MTVREFMESKPNGTFYLIPNILSNQKLGEPSHHYGHQVSNIGNVNKEIIDKGVVKYYKEDDKIIVIWKNE